MEQSFRALQNENYQLREYILTLQSRLLENQSDIPPAPSQVNVSAGARRPTRDADSSSAVEQQLRREMQGPAAPPVHMQHQQRDAMSHLQAAAAQASEARSEAGPYGLGSEYPSKRSRPDDAGASGGDTKPPQ